MDWMDVKAGDKVARTSRGTGARVYTVERLTATQIVLAGTGVRLRRRTGKEVGEHSWSTARWTCDPDEILRCELEQERWRIEARLEAALVQAARSCKTLEALRRLDVAVEAACAEAREGV